MIKAIIFDFDGVLTDNTDMVVKVYQEAAALCGKPKPSRKKIVQYLGTPGPYMVKHVIGKNPNCRIVQQQVWEKYDQGMKLMPGLESVFKKLNFKTAIVTSRSKKMLVRSLGKYKKYFFVITAPEDSAKHKPNPEPILLTCKKLKAKPAEAIYVGDTLIDQKTAKRAGTKFIAMLSGAYSKAEFKKYKVKYFINSLKDLPKLIKQIEMTEN